VFFFFHANSPDRPEDFVLAQWNKGVKESSDGSWRPAGPMRVD
jgi:hypothetical protein